MVTAPNETQMRENIEINTFYIEEEKCVKIKKKVKSFLKDNTEPIPHLHPCTST